MGELQILFLFHVSTLDAGFGNKSFQEGLQY